MILTFSTSFKSTPSVMNLTSVTSATKKVQRSKEHNTYCHNNDAASCRGSWTVALKPAQKQGNRSSHHYLYIDMHVSQIPQVHY